MHGDGTRVSRARPPERAQWFDDLGRQNADTRPGVGLIDGLPDLLWRRVPAGSFWMGGDPLALGAWPGRQVDLQSDVWMAAYPVTVCQYRRLYRRRWLHRTLQRLLAVDRPAMEAAVQHG